VIGSLTRSAPNTRSQERSAARSRFRIVGFRSQLHVILNLVQDPFPTIDGRSFGEMGPEPSSGRRCAIGEFV